MVGDSKCTGLKSSIVLLLNKMANRKKSVSKQEKNNFVYRNFINGLKYIRETRNYIWFCSCLFLFIALIGYFFPVFFTEEILKLIKELLKQTEGLNGIELIRFIIVNNTKSSFFGIALGLFFGVFPIGMLVVNGYVIGFVASKSVMSEGILVLWRLLPHGIFEIPAVLISIGIGLKLGIFPFYIKDKSKGILSLLLGFIMFFFSFSILMTIVLFFKNPELLISGSKMISSDYVNLLGTPFMGFVSVILMSLCYILGIYFGLMVLNKEDKKVVIQTMKNSFTVFIFIVVPLLVIAGIIEGSLIALIK